MPKMITEFNGDLDLDINEMAAFYSIWDAISPNVDCN